MIKTYISMIVVAVLLLTGAILQDRFVEKEFCDLESSSEIVYQKVNDKTATIDDIYALQNIWLEKKEKLHAFIPHSEIKEIDLWISESATLVRDEKWEDAVSKIEVLKELCEQIPTNFVLSWENIL